MVSRWKADVETLNRADRRAGGWQGRRSHTDGTTGRFREGRKKNRRILPCRSRNNLESTIEPADNCLLRGTTLRRVVSRERSGERARRSVADWRPIRGAEFRVRGVAGELPGQVMSMLT